jgi:broad specificity phosphatase PhoE
MTIQKIHLVRHGQTDWNVSGRWQGQLPTGLNEQGHQQAQQLAQHMKAWPITRISSSDLPRAQETAQAVADGRDIAIELDARWREIDLGVFQGLMWQEIVAQHPTEFAAYETDFYDYMVPGGESRRQVQARALASLSAAVRCGEGEIAFVSHGVTLRVALMGLLPDEAERIRMAEIGNVSITTLHRINGAWQLEQLAFIGHVEVPVHLRGEAAW